MTLEDIIDEARARFRDTAAPFFWTDEQWTDVANEAEQEACRRARLLVDSTTTEITKLTLSATRTIHELDERIIFVRRVKLVSRSVPLPRRLVRTLDAGQPGWEDETGTPRAYVPDYSSGKLRFFPLADAADTASLTVIRLPLEDMDVNQKTSVSPEINRRFHRRLIDWMLYRAYNRQDVETFDEKKAASYLAEFESEFGPASNAVNETWQEHHEGEDQDEGQY